MYKTFFSSLLEQFQVLPLIPFFFNNFDFSITNETVILVLICLFSVFFFKIILNKRDSSFSLIPKRFQSIIEIIYKLILSLVVDNIKDKKGQYFFSLVFFVFMFVMSLNLIGLVPFVFSILICIYLNQAHKI
jgi:F-type H+-transporting ATPase subunit a